MCWPARLELLARLDNGNSSTAELPLVVRAGETATTVAIYWQALALKSDSDQVTKPDDYVMRIAGREDLEAVLNVLAEGRDTRNIGAAASQRQRQTWDRMMGTADMSVYLAERSGSPVGTAAAMVMPHLTYDCHPTAFIEAVVVKKDHRRRGLATRLLARAVADAREAGCLKVQLLTRKRHATDGAHRFYESSGFTAEAEGFRLYLHPWELPT